MRKKGDSKTTGSARFVINLIIADNGEEVAAEP